MTTLLTATNLTKRYQSHLALDRVSLRIDAGKIISLIGPNGAGKSTLLKMLVGLEKPDSGTLYISDGTKIGYVPQKLEFPATFPMTVHGFLHLRHAKASHDTLHERLNAMDIDYLFDKSLHTLSEGELRRVLLVRAMLKNPNLLILDEPIEGVDVAGQVELYGLIETLNQETGCAVLMVSHDLHLVMASTHHVICLHHHICCEGQPKQVNNDPAFINAFGQNIAENLALYSHTHDHTHDLHGDAHGAGHCTHPEHQHVKGNSNE